MGRFFSIGLVFFALFLFCSSAFAAKISSKEFLSSDFSKTFQNKKYKKALKESDALLKKYPQDPLLLRYRALTLEKLKQPQKAIRLYQTILAAHPDDIPARLFLGLAYVKQDEHKKAAKELRFVSQHAHSKEYRHWAEAQLNRLRQDARLATKPIKKKPYVLGAAGVAYDSNPLLIPDNANLVSKGKVDAARFLIELSAGYPLWLTKNFRADILYIGEEYLYSGSASDVDFASQGVAFDAKRRTFLGKRSVLLEGRYDFRANLLRSELFSVVNRFFASADISFWPKTQTHFYGRFGILNYELDGTNPDRSSRDGVRGGMGVTQYFYTASYKTFLFIKGEGNFNQTRGDNFDRRGALARVGIHTPFLLFKKSDFDVSGGLDWGIYPDFLSLSSLDTNSRYDKYWDVYAGVTRHWKPNFATRLFYRFIDSQNENAFFDHTQHIAGGKIIFAF